MLILLLNTAQAQDNVSNTHSMRNGLRMGYAYIANEPALASPNLFVVGYENIHTFSSQGPLSILMMSNVSIAGINQGEFIPTGFLVLGYQFQERLQLGVGPIVGLQNPMSDQASWQSNMLLAVGYNLDMDGFHLPLHVGFVPDVDDRWRVYATTGFNWSVNLKNK